MRELLTEEEFHLLIANGALAEDARRLIAHDAALRALLHAADIVPGSGGEVFTLVVEKKCPTCGAKKFKMKTKTDEDDPKKAKETYGL